jgi:arylsulfatase A-like enzyme
MFSRRKFVATSAALATSGLIKPSTLQGAVPEDAKSPRPNILIFMPDQQQGQTVLPTYPCHTPNVDRFASEGVTFPNAFCPAPHCCPSRASFQTGLYPSEHGVFNNVSNAAAIHPNPYPNLQYFSTVLKRTGYQLAYSGKWHVGRDILPQDVGWTNLTPDHNGQTFTPGKPKFNEHKARAKKEAQSGQGAAPHRDSGEVVRPGWGNRQMYQTKPDVGSGAYEGLEDYEIIKTGVEGIRSLASGKQPWCLMVSNSGGHDLYDAPKKFVDLYKIEDVKLPANFRDSLEDKPRIYQRMRYQYWSQMSDDEVRQCIIHYWAKLSMQDALFGLLLAELEKTGQAENTMVIYVSDHGDYAGAHGLYAKGVPSFREAYNIPCVIRWPSAIKNPGRLVDALVSTTDFAPTILDAAGVPPSEVRMSGKSLLPWLRGESPADWREAVFSQLNGVELYYTQRIVMTKDYKYVYNGFDYDELYDLKQDPHEMVNLAFPDVKLSRALVEEGAGLSNVEDLPWPHLPGHLNDVRRDLIKKMWRFAYDHNDQIFDSYATTAMSPLGPLVEIGLDLG